MSEDTIVQIVIAAVGLLLAGALTLHIAVRSECLVIGEDTSV